MQSVAAFFLISILIVTCSQSVLAAPASCLRCRAVYPFGDCPEASINNPLGNFVGLVGSVVATKPTDCSVQLTVRVTRSSSRTLPETVVIDVGPCAYWNGAVGDTISAVVHEVPKQTGVHQASPYCATNR
jgi:hypothetical protein